jgi:hypothetical protein
VAQAGTALDQTVLRAAGTQLGGDSLAYGPVWADDSNVGEEQGTMLDVQSSDQLLVLDLGGIERRDTQLARTREMVLVALVGALGVALKQGRCGCQGELHERGLFTGSHRGDQPVGGGGSIVLEAV